MTHVTCRLAAKNRDQLLNHTLGNRMWATFTFLKFLDTTGGFMFFECPSVCACVLGRKRSRPACGRVLVSNAGAVAAAAAADAASSASAAAAASFGIRHQVSNGAAVGDVTDRASLRRRHRSSRQR